VNWTKLAENRIEEAIANGEFKDLPGHGQPLDLGEYFAQPAAERAGAALLKNANVIPPEVQMLKEIGQLEEAVREAEVAMSPDQPHRSRRTDETPAQRLTKLRDQLQEKRVAFALAMERRRRREPRGLD
jgi:hypothetical protein